MEQPLLFLQHFVALELDRGNFDEALLVRTQAGGLGIEQDEGDLGDRRIGGGRAGGQGGWRFAVEDAHRLRGG